MKLQNTLGPFWDLNRDLRIRTSSPRLTSTRPLNSLTVDSRSSFLSPKPHRKACYAGYINWGIVISWLLPVKFDRYGIPVREASFYLYFFYCVGCENDLVLSKSTHKINSQNHCYTKIWHKEALSHCNSLSTKFRREFVLKGTRLRE